MPTASLQPGGFPVEIFSHFQHFGPVRRPIGLGRKAPEMRRSRVQPGSPFKF